MKLSIVDVFAEQKYAGNPLAVVEDCAHLDTATMQAIAYEMNFSETTFVTRRDADRATVRIFTPQSELPFAGHPTLGTAWVLAGGTGSYTLDLEVGAVPVTFAGDIGWMTPPAVSFKGDLPAHEAASLIRVLEDQLDRRYPARLAEVGPRFVLIGVKELAHLGAAALDADLHQRLLEKGAGVDGVFVFTGETGASAADFRARMFFDAGGIREDPATGSANAAFASYLASLGRTGEIVVDQGVEMRRPSRLYLRLGDCQQVGGRVVRVATGQLD